MVDCVVAEGFKA